MPDTLSPDEALRVLLADPILMRRPLMQVGERREVGFLAAVVDAWIGLAPVEPAAAGCGGCASAEGCASASGPGASGDGPLTSLGRQTR